MRFLDSLLSWFKKSPTKILSSSDDNNFVILTGKVARFSFETRDFFANGKPKPRIFSQETHPVTQRIETSICGLNGVATERIWYLGNSIRAPRTALAAVEIAVVSITNANLQCEPAREENYDEHGVIVGWNEDKSARLAESQELVEKVSNILRPN